MYAQHITPDLCVMPPLSRLCGKLLHSLTDVAEDACTNSEAWQVFFLHLKAYVKSLPVYLEVAKSALHSHAVPAEAVEVLLPSASPYGFMCQDRRV